MSYLGDLLRSIDHNRSLLVGAVLIAAATGLILWYAPKYDNPESFYQSKTADILVLGRKGTFRISCNCPPYLVAGRSRSLAFESQIKLSQLQSPQPTSTSLPSLTSIMVAVGVPTDSQQYHYTVIDSASALFAQGGGNTYENVDIANPGADFSGINFPLVDYASNGAILEQPASVRWAIPARPNFLRVVLPGLATLLVFVLALFSLHSMNQRWRYEEQQLKDAQAKAAENPEQASPTWEFAGTNLQQYFSRNLAQVRQVFYVSVGVMLVGFSFVIYGVYEQIALQQVDANHISPPTWVASICGLITQFIGATFMVIYRSTMTQANEFVSVLDRINTVGIAVKVLDQIPNDNSDKNIARVEFIRNLVGWRSGAPQQSSPRQSQTAASEAYKGLDGSR